MVTNCRWVCFNIRVAIFFYLLFRRVAELCPWPTSAWECLRKQPEEWEARRSLAAEVAIEMGYQAGNK